jgi:MSHA biogenesis protein MshN
MSVVNKMLNDLENRDQNSGISADYQPPEKRKLPLTWIIAIVIFVAIGGAFAYWQFSSEWFGQQETNTVRSSLPVAANNQTSQVAEQTGGDQDNERGVTSANQQSSIDESALSDLAQIAQKETQRIRNSEPSPVESAVTERNEDSMLTAMESKTPATSDEVMEATASSTKAMIDKEMKAQTDNVEPELVISNQIVNVSSDGDSVTTNIDSKPELLEDEPAEARTVMAIKPSGDAEPDALKLSAQKALADKDAPKAIELLSKILNEQPDNVNARKQLASLLFANRESGKAETLLQYGLQQNAQQHDIRLMLARLYQQNERYADALTLLQAVSPDATLNIDYYNQRASLSQRLNDFKQASQDYQILANIEPGEAKWWLGIGVSADRLNESNTAITAYTKALSLNQLDSRVTAFMQERLRGLGR